LPIAHRVARCSRSALDRASTKPWLAHAVGPRGTPGGGRPFLEHVASLCEADQHCKGPRPLVVQRLTAHAAVCRTVPLTSSSTLAASSCSPRRRPGSRSARASCEQEVCSSSGGRGLRSHDFHREVGDGAASTHQPGPSKRPPAEGPQTLKAPEGGERLRWPCVPMERSNEQRPSPKRRGRGRPPRSLQPLSREGVLREALALLDSARSRKGVGAKAPRRAWAWTPMSLYNHFASIR